MKFLPVLFFSILLLASCNEPLDFNNSQFYDVQDVLESSNCAADCEEVADCENQRVKMIGTIDPSNIDAINFQFNLVDRSNQQVEMEVVVDSSEAAVVFALISDQGDEQVRITGLLEGMDGSSSSNCQREISMKLTSSDDIELVE